MRPALATPTCLAALALLMLAGVAPAADPVPRDAQGLPTWEVRAYADFPVRIVLHDAEALQDLLARVPLRSFAREDVKSMAETGVIVEPRVTEAEARALEAAGFAFERIPDVEQQERRAIEAEWRRQAEAGEASLRTLPDKGVYHTHAQIGTILQAAETNHPTLCVRSTLGTSVNGRDLWTLKITDNPGVEEAEPEVRLAGTIHGNEPPGQEMLLYLIDWLTTQYGIDPDVTDLVDNTEIWITPCLNPDGLTSGTRTNAHGIDLNRNYPVPNGAIGDDGTWTQEPETIATRTFGEAHRFVVSENGHTGTMVVNYPWDWTYTRAPDDAALILLSLEYSTYNTPMYNGPFYHGITNGADWYIVWGSLQDCSYHFQGNAEVTIELSTSYAPPASQLDTMWNNNRQSFVHFIRAARYGIHGVVTDAVTGAPLDALITVAGNTKTVRTDPDHGDYYKLLPTGTYSLLFEAPGHLGETITGVSTTWGTPTVLDVALWPEGAGAPVAAAASAGLVASPNPFRERTELRFSVGRAGPVRVTIHDAGGRLVRTLADEARGEGAAVVPWDGRTDAGQRAADGVYFVRLRTADGEQARKITRTK